MKVINIRNLSIGSGMPVICAPVTGRDMKEITDQAEKVSESAADMLEWRCDWFEEKTVSAFMTALGNIREAVGDEMPVLMTLRTRSEGGEWDISPEDYMKIYKNLIDKADTCNGTFPDKLPGTGHDIFPDLIDVQLSAGEEIVSALVSAAHKKDIKVIMSSHDFNKTPSSDHMKRILLNMQEAGADIAKMAVMSRSMQDVLRLLSVTEEMSRSLQIPLITMAMGRMGLITRLSGEDFGSAVTFGTAGRASAPGQIDTERLKDVLKLIHES